ncbi:hypothetical protein ACLOJK_000522 [Asimina triloba]
MPTHNISFFPVQQRTHNPQLFPRTFASLPSPSLSLSMSRHRRQASQVLPQAFDLADEEPLKASDAGTAIHGGVAASVSAQEKKLPPLPPTSLQQPPKETEKKPSIGGQPKNP